MFKPDFPEFRAILDTLAKAFGKPPPDDVTTQAFWNALKDLPLPTVKRCAEYHTRYGKHFPRPVELRPQDDKPKGDVREDSAFGAANERAKRWVDSAANGADALAKARLEDAYLTRRLLSLHEADPAYPDVKRAWQRNGDELTRLHGVSR